jgi:7,8-dihydropterin-6-yl-methyl-4-(beta-D-ribofuranosyl)aminobenzene 5'-phosphate synthase
MQTFCITLLCDNQTIRDDLKREHGLAMWIETPEARILFDTGQGATLEPNAKTLGIDLAQADAIVLSHGHYDHTGGLPAAMNLAPTAPICFHPAAVIPRFSRQPDGSLKSIGMADAVHERLQSSLACCPYSGLTEIAPAVRVIGAIPRRNDFENVDHRFFLDLNQSCPDPIEDELVIWIETRRGIILLTGCCHHGIVNTIEHVQQIAGAPINSIIGGLHLLHSAENQLEATIKAFNKLPNLEQIVLCHCTGDAVTARMRNECRAKVIKGYAGLTVGFRGKNDRKKGVFQQAIAVSMPGRNSVDRTGLYIAGEEWVNT